MPKKKVLIITYYWPPTGGSGVQRWLKFVKYLPEFGWEPIVYTPENPENPVLDESLLSDIPKNCTVLKTRIWEPYRLFKKFTGTKNTQSLQAGFISGKNKTLKERIAVWVRGNLFIPDARKYWIKPSVKYLTDYLQKNRVEAVITTGPPHSMHLIGLGLKKKLTIKWIADFRDPWTNIDFFGDLMLSSVAHNKHIRLEREVLLKADKIITIGEEMKKEFVSLAELKGAAVAAKTHVITNGYDETDVFKGEIELDKKFSIAHIGTLNTTRNPKLLWKVLNELCLHNADFAGHLEIKLIGKVESDVLADLEKSKLAPYLTHINYLPHKEVTKLQQQAQLLLLLVNNTPNAKGILTGKFFEYLAAKRPVLCIGPEDGEVAGILRETAAGSISGFDDENKLRENILTFFNLYKQQKLQVNSSGVEKYSRRELTRKLVDLLRF